MRYLLTRKDDKEREIVSDKVHPTGTRRENAPTIGYIAIQQDLWITAVVVSIFNFELRIGLVQRPIPNQSEFLIMKAVLGPRRLPGLGLVQEGILWRYISGFSQLDRLQVPYPHDVGIRRRLGASRFKRPKVRIGNRADVQMPLIGHPKFESK